MKSFVKRALSAGAAALCLLSVSTGAQAAVYRLTDLGDLAGGFNRSRAYDINNLGQVVGFSSGGTGTPDGSLRAFIWDSVNGMQALTNLSGTTSRAYAINDAGQITGEYWSEGSSSSARAFRWDNGTVQNLGTLSTTGFNSKVSLGSGINASGQVAGESYLDSNKRGVIWGSGTPEQLPRLSGANYSSATDINDSGLVVGNSGPRAFSYQNGTMTGLRNLSTDVSSSSAFAVNNAGQIVGQSTGDEGPSAVLWNGSEIFSLGDLADGAFMSQASGINNKGQVVGFGTAKNAIGNDVRHAFVWDAESGMLDLNSLVDPSDPLFGRFTLLEADAINDLGQIVGRAVINGAEHAFLLTPVPEPHQYGMMLAGLGMVGWMVRRRRIDPSVGSLAV